MMAGCIKGRKIQNTACWNLIKYMWNCKLALQFRAKITEGVIRHRWYYSLISLVTIWLHILISMCNQFSMCNQMATSEIREYFHARFLGSGNY